MLMKSSVNVYDRTLTQYCNFTNKNPTVLIEEAELEEVKRIHMKTLKTKKTTLNYHKLINGFINEYRKLVNIITFHIQVIKKKVKATVQQIITIMVEVKILEFGYSLESNLPMMKFLIKGMDKKSQDQMLNVLENIPLGELKRFEIISNTNDDLILLERFSVEEYPFKLNIPSDDEILSVENMVKKFMAKDG
jgi:hypothetical protein